MNSESVCKNEPQWNFNAEVRFPVAAGVHTSVYSVGGGSLQLQGSENTETLVLKQWNQTTDNWQLSEASGWFSVSEASDWFSGCLQSI